MIILITGASITDNGTILAFSIIGIIVIAIAIIVSAIKYYFTKKWYESWYDYKNSIHYSKIMAFTFIVYPILGILNYAGNTTGFVISNVINLISITATVISIIHTFILKSNNLTKDINNAYEYTIASIILKIVYLPIIIPILGITIVLVGNTWFTLFGISYLILIIVSLIIRNPINEKIEDTLAIICFVLAGIMGILYDPSIIGSMLGIYIDYTVVSVVIIDVTNDWIIKKRHQIQDYEGNIGIIARDSGYGNSDLIQLRTSYDNVPSERNSIQEP